MSGLKSGLVTVVVAGAIGVFTVVGCTADGTSSVVDENAPGETEGATLPPAGGETTPTDAGKPAPPKDAGTKDSATAVDAGPPPPVPDTPCPTLDEVKTKPCGACGTQSTICLDVAGTKKWSVYSTCVGELVGGCIPGTVVNEACGNCGTQKKSCTQFCAFSVAACTGQPANACVPGSVELQNAGCPSADVYHQRTCGPTCTAPNFDAVCTAPPTTVEVGPTVGSVTSTVAILTSAQTMPNFSTLASACTSVTLSTTVTTAPYVYINVHNPLATAATVAIYNILAPGGVVFETQLAAYDGTTGPTDEASRKLCVRGSTYGTTALTGNSLFASLDGTTKQVTIAAGATVSVYVGAQKAYDPANPATSTGKVNLNVATISLQ
jgi:hypothetical protein